MSNTASAAHASKAKPAPPRAPEDGHSGPLSGFTTMFTGPLAPIFFVVFIDLIGVGIALPVLAPLFLDAQHGLFHGAESLEWRTALMGILIASYSFAQFLGAPILGGLSDRYGRKKLLLLSLAGTFFGYILFGLGILTRDLPLLFAGRIIDGITGGNISIALSAIADVSDAKSKTKNFGLIGMAFGLGFIIGPFVGGLLSDHTLVSWFDYATPFWFAAALVLINIAMMWVQFHETLRTKTHVKIDPLMGIRNVAKAMGMPALRTLFAVSFLYMFGFALYNQFLQVFLFEKFNFGASNIGLIFAYIGLCVALVQGLFTGPIAKRWKPSAVLSVCLLGAALTLVSLVLPTAAWMLYLPLTFLALFIGLAMPNLRSVISDLGGPESQGELMGLNQSVQSLAMAIPPLLAGVAIAFGVDMPMLLAGGFIFLGWGVLVAFFKEKTQPKFHEV